MNVGTVEPMLCADRLAGKEREGKKGNHVTEHKVPPGL
jgi:hypothetical protein